MIPRSRTALSLLAALGLVFIGWPGAEPAQAGGGIIVTVTDDPADGLCPGPKCSLRAAIKEANLAPDSNTITLMAATYKLTRKGGGEDAAETGDLDITSPIEIQGVSVEDTVIDGKKAKDRLIDVIPGGAGGNLTLRDLTVKNGSAPKELGAASEGGGIRVAAGTQATLTRVVVTKNKAFVKGSNADGGGMLVDGTATLTDVVVSSNKAKSDSGGIEIDGGTLNLERVLLAKNSSKGEGGAISTAGSINATNVTFSGNKSKQGGALRVSQDASATNLKNVTIASNTGKDGGGITIGSGSPTVNLTNTIVANNKGGDCAGTADVLAGQDSLDTDDSCAGTTHTKSGPPLQLGPLADNNAVALPGSLMKTHAILSADSPAVDNGTSCPPPIDDQRGFGREPNMAIMVMLPICDSGAFEFGSSGPFGPRRGRER